MIVDAFRAVKKMKEEIRYSDEVRLAVSAFSALHSNNYSRFFAVVDQASYLQASLLHRYFKQVGALADPHVTRHVELEFSSAESRSILSSLPCLNGVLAEDWHSLTRNF